MDYDWSEARIIRTSREKDFTVKYYEHGVKPQQSTFYNWTVKELKQRLIEMKNDGCTDIVVYRHKPCPDCEGRGYYLKKSRIKI